MTHNKFDLSESLDRMGTILSGNGDQYRKFSYIPNDNLLEEFRGSFVDCVVLVSRLFFMANDINLLGLAKIFDMYMNEVKIIMSELPLCKAILVHGYTITGIYNIGTDEYMSSIMDVAGRVKSLPEIINVRSGRKEKPVINNVCAMEKGQLYVTKSTQEVNYFGKMIDRAEGWVSKGVKDEKTGLFISKQVHLELKSQYQGFFNIEETDVLFGKIENVGMASWVKEQNKK